MKIPVLIPFLAIFLVGCVYSFKQSGKSEISSIAVERFGNNSAELGLTDRMTDLVIDALIAKGSINVVSYDNAAALLSGTLLSYSRRPKSYDVNDQVSEYEVVMNFEISLKNPSDGSEIWKEQMSQSGIYDIQTESEEIGQNRAIDLLVETIISRTTKSW